MFRFRARVVDDPLAQQNFEQLEAELGRGWAVGDIKQSAVFSAQAGWLLCDGTALTSTSQYAALRQALLDAASPYGVDGSGNPKIPPAGARALTMASSGGGLQTRALGAQYGGEAPTMPAHSTGNDTPDHSHNVSPVYFHGGGTAGSIQNAGTGAFPLDDGTVTSAGANQRHTHPVGAVGSAVDGNVPPSIAFYTFIKT